MKDGVGMMHGLLDVVIRRTGWKSVTIGTKAEEADSFGVWARLGMCGRVNGWHKYCVERAAKQRRVSLADGVKDASGEVCRQSLMLGPGGGDELPSIHPSIYSFVHQGTVTALGLVDVSVGGRANRTVCSS